MRANEFITEGWRTNTLVAALTAALSISPAQAQELPDAESQISPAAKALILYRTINRYKNYGSAGLEGEARQEFNNIMRSIQGHPNQSKLYPIIKKALEEPNTSELPPLTGEQP